MTVLPDPVASETCERTAVVAFVTDAMYVPNVKLDTLCSHFGITIRTDGVAGKHRSDEDAVATAKLLVALMREIEPVEEVAG